MDKIDIGTHINLNEYSDLVEACINDGPAAPDQKGTGVAAPGEALTVEAAAPLFEFAVLAPRRKNYAVLACIVVELLLLCAWGVLGAAGMGAVDERAAAEELADKLGGDADLAAKLDRFLAKSKEIGTTRDLRFVQLVEELNRGMRGAEEKGRPDRFRHEDFHPEYFVFIGDMLRYVPPVEE